MHRIQISVEIFQTKISESKKVSIIFKGTNFVVNKAVGISKPATLHRAISFSLVYEFTPSLLLEDAGKRNSKNRNCVFHLIGWYCRIHLYSTADSYIISWPQSTVLSRRAILSKVSLTFSVQNTSSKWWFSILVFNWH